MHAVMYSYSSRKKRRMQLFAKVAGTFLPIEEREFIISSKEADRLYQKSLNNSSDIPQER